MSVRRNTKDRRTLFRICGICGKSIITTADTPWVRQVPQGEKKQATVYYCSTGCYQASYKHIGWYDGKYKERKQEYDANRDRREYNSAYYAAHREEICARKRAQYWADHDGSLKTLAYQRKKRKLLVG